MKFIRFANRLWFDAVWREFVALGTDDLGIVRLFALAIRLLELKVNFRRFRRTVEERLRDLGEEVDDNRFLLRFVPLSLGFSSSSISTSSFFSRILGV